MATLIVVCGWIICILIGLYGATVLWKIWSGEIDLSDLISEANGGASLSRFQFLIFTFVIAFSLYLVIVAHPGGPQFPATIPATILSLLGISGSSYLVSKGIQFSDPAGISERGTEVIISPTRTSVGYGKTQQFTAEVPGKPGSKVKWEVIAGPGSIDDNGLYTAPPAPTAPAPPVAGAGAAAPAAGAAGTPGATPATPSKQYATIQVTSLEVPDAYDVAVVLIA
jgi:hypothetical protein